jgi:hypothetical protein
VVGHPLFVPERARITGPPSQWAISSGSSWHRRCASDVLSLLARAKIGAPIQALDNSSGKPTHVAHGRTPKLRDHEVPIPLKSTSQERAKGFGDWWSGRDQRSARISGEGSDGASTPATSHAPRATRRCSRQPRNVLAWSQSSVICRRRSRKQKLISLSSARSKNCSLSTGCYFLRYISHSWRSFIVRHYHRGKFTQGPARAGITTDPKSVRCLGRGQNSVDTGSTGILELLPDCIWLYDMSRRRDRKRTAIR